MELKGKRNILAKVPVVSWPGVNFSAPEQIELRAIAESWRKRGTVTSIEDEGLVISAHTIAKDLTKLDEEMTLAIQKQRMTYKKPR